MALALWTAAALLVLASPSWIEAGLMAAIAWVLWCRRTAAANIRDK